MQDCISGSAPEACALAYSKWRHVLGLAGLRGVYRGREQAHLEEEAIERLEVVVLVGSGLSGACPVPVEEARL